MESVSSLSNSLVLSKCLKIKQDINSPFVYVASNIDDFALICLLVYVSVLRKLAGVFDLM